MIDIFPYRAGRGHSESGGTMRRTFTINIEPIGDGRLKVTIPEIGVTVETQGDTQNDAIDAAHQAIIAHLRAEWEASHE